MANEVEVLKKSALINSIDASNAATSQATDAAADALSSAGVDPNFISYEKGTLPDSTGANNGTIGAYVTSGDLFQKVEWTGSEWVEVGEPVSTRKYVDDKASLLRDEIREEVSTEKVKIKDSLQGESISSDGRLRLGDYKEDLPLVVFIDDDGANEAYTHLMPLFTSRNVPACVGIISNTVGTAAKMTYDQIREQQNVHGWEVLSHSINNTTLDLLSEPDLITALSDSREELISEGLNITNFVYPGGNSNELIRRHTRKHYRSAVSTTGENAGYAPTENIPPFDTYNLRRERIDGDAPNPNYADYKQVVDKAIANNELLIFMTHARFPSNFEEIYVDKDGNSVDQFVITGQIIDYIISQGVDIVTLNDALDRVGNLADFSDPAIGTFSQAIGYDGSLRNIKMSIEKTLMGFRTQGLELTGGATAYGGDAGFEASGEDKTMIGRLSGFQSTGGFQSALGVQAGRGSSGSNQSVVGYRAGRDNSGNNQTGFGISAGENNTGHNQVAIGFQAGLNNQGDDQVAIGERAAFNNTGDRGVFIGKFSGQNNANNTVIAIGESSARDNTGTSVTFLGFQAGDGNTGNHSVGIGREALKGNTEHSVFCVEQRNINPNPLVKGYFDTGALITGAPSSAVPNSSIGANRMSFYLDESTDKLFVKVKYADGTTIKEGEVALV